MAASKISLLLVVLVALYEYANAHAILVNPAGWNQDPSTSPCSKFTKINVALATWRATEQVIVGWKVVAGDGVGDVTVYLDPAGGVFDSTDMSNYTKIGTGPSPTVSAANILISAVPNINCTGTNGLCTIMAVSTSNWRSCSTVAITPPCVDCPAPTLPPPTCQNAGSLTFCKMYSGRPVYVPIGYTAQSLDAGTQITYTNYIGNPKVFSNPSDTCKTLYTNFLCLLNNPPCPGSDKVAHGAACRQMCTNAMTTCQLNATHNNLYPCDTFPECENAAMATAPLFAMIALFALLALLL